jgi:hypothetical protein
MTKLDEAIQTVADALGRGEIGYEGLYSPLQSNCKGVLEALGQWLWDKKNQDAPITTYMVIAKIAQLHEEMPRPAEVVAINKPMTGRVE